MSVILLLGEGDFSFTVALQHRLTALLPPPPPPLAALPPQPVTVVATSYDAAADVDAKYPFARSTLDALVKRHPGRLRVCHDVDATKPLLSQLAATLEALPPVRHVVFNFPHLGYEDCRSHASLAAHVFHRVRELFDAQQVRCLFPHRRAQRSTNFLSLAPGAYLAAGGGRVVLPHPRRGTGGALARAGGGGAVRPGVRGRRAFRRRRLAGRVCMKLAQLA
jgi:hypothetical protein